VPVSPQQGYKEEALVVSRDLDQKFELALELKKLTVAKELLGDIQKEEKDAQSTDTQQKWRKLGDLVGSSSSSSISSSSSSSSRRRRRSPNPLPPPPPPPPPPRP